MNEFTEQPPEDAIDGSAPEGAGPRLRQAREQAGITLEQLAAQTRIPVRHLEVVENGRFEELPARTYAIGFSRTYAREVGLDERVIADQVRDELGSSRYNETQHIAKFEPGDPARVPSRGLAWFSAFAALLLIVGGLMFFRGYFFPGSGPGPLTQETEIAQTDDDGSAVAAEASARPTGEVVFTALESELWVRFYDATGERLMEKQMAEGERYTVPADVEGPQIWTGQPEALAISIGGDDIGTLSDESEILRDIPVTAPALLDWLEANEAADVATAEGTEDAAEAAG